MEFESNRRETDGDLRTGLSRWTGLAAYLAGLAAVFTGAPAAGEERFVFERAEMGLPVRVTLYAQSQPEARLAADAAFQRIERLNAIFSDYDSDSELSRLSDSSGQGQPIKVSAELWQVVEYSQQIAARSEGAFDMSVGPLVNLWRAARRKKELPSRARIDEALGRSGYSAVRLDAQARTVELMKPRMRLDAGGVAKGYAMEEALKVLKELGHSRAMVSGGGDMALGDPPPGQTGWRIEINALDEVGAPVPRFLRVASRCVSTSGDFYQRLEIDGKRYSHIVDPRTGIGLTDHSLVTVVALHGMEADALSKVVAVLGPDEGIPIVEEMPGTAVHVVRSPGGRVREYFSSRWMGLER